MRTGRTLRPAATEARAPERTLILGWNTRGATVVSELDKYAMPGSELTIIADDDRPGDDLDGLHAIHDAMRNTRKHAEATSVRVATRLAGSDGDDWTLEVRDDGRGFTEALVEYGMGRPFGFLDEPLATAILTEAQAKDYQMAAFIRALVLSETFQTK